MMLKKTALFVLTGLLVFAAAATIFVERESEYLSEILNDTGELNALVLYHPSRDAGFTDELSSGVAAGLASAGFAVQRHTVTRNTPVPSSDINLVVFICNTYWWSPDLPTLRYLKRVNLKDTDVVGIVGGAGSTTRAARLFQTALMKAGANVLTVQEYWLYRPNDDTNLTGGDNRVIAVNEANALGASISKLIN